MQLIINGECAQSSADTVASLLRERNLDPKRVVVERNRAVVAREDYDVTPLREGDTLELVQFVGGG